MSITTRIRKGWNAFQNKDPTDNVINYSTTVVSTSKPDRHYATYGNERTIINSILTRISVSAASVNLIHCETDENGKFIAKYYGDGNLNDIFSIHANNDQTGKAFLIDAVYSLLQEGQIAIVPTDMSDNPWLTESYNIRELRVAKILSWYPDSIKVRVFNEHTNKFEDVKLPKSACAIVENPFYSVMNQPNSTLKRLNRKLILLDITDEHNNSGRLDLIIQLPYSTKADSRKKRAEERVSDIEMQLSGSQHGIAYADSTEKIVQLNRPVENQLQSQIEYLTKTLYSQLGISEEILNGTADERQMINFFTNVVEPILDAIVDAMNWKFITKNGRTRGQALKYFRDPFKLVTVSSVASIADTFIRNEILSTNEVRGIIGYMPSNDPKADELRNPNMPIEDQQSMIQEPYGDEIEYENPEDEEYVE